MGVENGGKRCRRRGEGARGDGVGRGQRAGDGDAAGGGEREGAIVRCRPMRAVVAHAAFECGYRRPQLRYQLNFAGKNSAISSS